jgi:hypothetical protein
MSSRKMTGRRLGKLDREGDCAAPYSDGMSPCVRAYFVNSAVV